MQVVEDYIAVWNETDPDRRRELVGRVFADDATYVDAHRSGAGTTGIDEMIAAAQEQFPGHKIQLKSGPDAHNDRVRFAWTLHDPSGDPLGGGADFAKVAGDGRFSEVTGFPEPVA